MSKEKNKGILRKHTASIHCSNTLSLLQRKLSNALLYNAYPKLMEHGEHLISVKDLCRLIGYKGNNDKVIKEALKELISTVLEWNVIDEKTLQENWTASSMLASVNLKGGICRYAYSQRLRELFYNPSMYGRINLYIQSKFTSGYGLALYENCVRYKGLKYTKEFSMDMFRRIMGVPEDKYTVFRDFTRRVINKAVEEVNINSDLFVAPEIKRVGRKPVSIKFKIKEREKKKKFGQLNAESSKSEFMDKEVIDFMEFLNSNYGIGSSEAQKLIKQYGIDKIKEKIQIIEVSDKYKQGQIKSLAAYLIKAIKDDYLPAKSSQDIISLEKIEEERIAAAERETEAEKETKLKKIKNLYNKYVEQEIKKILSGFSGEEQTKIYSGFENDLVTNSNTMVLKRYRDQSLESPMVKAIFHDFIFNNYSELVHNIIDFDKFSKDRMKVNNEILISKVKKSEF